jgi:sec-independent protein translocase protein TatA
MEIAIVLVIALIVFGPKRLPELGKSLGRGISEFKQGVSSIGDSVSGDHKHEDEHEPVELTGSEAGSSADVDPEVTEVKPSPSHTSPEAEAVDGEVVADRQN